MSDVKIELNLPGINEMMKSPKMQTHLQKASDMVASAAGDGYIAETETINWVAITTVKASTKEAGLDNLKHNTLLKALGSVGLPMR